MGAIKIAGGQAWDAELGVLIYAVRFHAALVYVMSDRQLLSEEQASKRYNVVTKPTREMLFTPQAIERFMHGAGTNPLELYHTIKTLLTTHVQLPSTNTAALLSVWVMGTYLYQLFMFFPYIAIHSADRRCGKTLLLNILHEIVFFPPAVQYSPSTAILFHETHRHGGTLLIDEVETLTDADKEVRAQMLSILCGGFQAGGVVSRCEAKPKGGYDVTEFTVYAPKAFAGINEVADVVRDRSLGLFMVRTHKRKPRFNLRLQTSALAALRDELHIFGLTKAREIALEYENAETMKLPTGIDDRARDVCEPLFTVARIIGGEAEAELYAAIEEIVSMRKIEEAHSEGDLEVARYELRRALAAHITRKGAEPFVITTDVALAIFQDAGLDGMDKPRSAQAVLHRLSIFSKPHRVNEQVIRGYKITAEQLEPPQPRED